nr:X-linked retinitis pigmentosa GTPase regulator-interacting protein 1-like [Lytechinus pictus]
MSRTKLIYPRLFSISFLALVDESSIEEDVEIPEPDDDEDEEEAESKAAKNDNVISSDSESVIIPATPTRPVSAMANEDTIIINIGQLTIDQDASLITDDTIHRLFVEYQFLGIAQEELETPFSLPKPGPNGPFELSYNFHKVIHIDGDMTKRNYLADFLRPDHSEKGRLRFTVVSEPPDEFQEDAECIEVGYAYVDLRALLEEGRDLTDSDIEVVNVHDESEPIGSVTVTVYCVAALGAIQREVEALRAEEDEEDDDIDTDEEA